jgi:hypothetical protein
LGATSAQLAKPAVEPTAWGLLTKGLRYEVLTWVGIVGGALTLFTNLGAVLKLADWARILVQHWKEWTHAFWVWAFGWLGIQVPPEWTPVLSFLLFASSLTIGQATQFNWTIRHPFVVKAPAWRSTLVGRVPSPIVQSIENRYRRNSFVAIFNQISIYLAFMLFVSGIATLAYQAGTWSNLTEWTFMIPIILTVVIAGILVISATSGFYVVVVVLLMIAFWVTITINQLTAISYDAHILATALGIIFAVPVILLSVAPAKAVARRLIFLALGLLLLIGLNELSKLGLDVTPPKLQG